MHEHPDMHPPATTAVNLFQPLMENQAVVISFKHRLPAIATGHHMIDRTRILESQRPCHAPSLQVPAAASAAFCFIAGIAPEM